MIESTADSGSVLPSTFYGITLKPGNRFESSPRPDECRAKPEFQDLLSSGQLLCLGPSV